MILYNKHLQYSEPPLHKQLVRPCRRSFRHLARLGSVVHAVTIMSLICIFIPVSSLYSAESAPQATGETFFGPFSSWINVCHVFGAKGDGKSDDTDALQKALTKLSIKPGKPEYSTRRTLYLPAGTYRITRRLEISNVGGIAILGEHPETATLLWDGPEGGEMMWFNGKNSRFGRFTWDGNGKARAGLLFHWNGRGKNIDQGPSYRLKLLDLRFKDMGTGVDAGGKLGWLDSEVVLQRCIFTNCSEYGIGLRHFNAVDWWIWNCRFEDCGVGVSNEPGPQGGVFHVYESTFLRSKRADMSIFHTGFFAARDNISIGSNRFYHARNHGVNGAAMTLQNNTIQDTVQPDAILLETCGPITLLDNTVISRPGHAGPAIRVAVDARTSPPAAVPENAPRVEEHYLPVAVTAIGNQATVEPVLEVKGALTEHGSGLVDVERLDAGSLPLPVPLPVSEAKVFEVPAAATQADLQQAIDAAATWARENDGQRPVVHLPPEGIELTETLILPADTPLALIGDGAYKWYDGMRGTILRWNGTDGGGPMLNLQGPSKVLLQGFSLLNPKVKNLRRQKTPLHPAAVTAGIVVEKCDQPGARVFLENCDIGANGSGVLVDRTDWLQVEMRAHQGSGLNTWSDNWTVNDNRDWLPFPSVRVIGGERTASGEETTGRVDLFGVNTGRFRVDNGGRLLVRDMWYESNWAPFHIRFEGSGRFTFDCAYDWPFTSKAIKGPAGYTFDTFRGKASFISIIGVFDDNSHQMAFAGDCSDANILLAGTRAPLTALPEPTDAAGATLHRLATLADLAPVKSTTPDPAWLEDMVSQTRTARPQRPAPSPAGITDVRLYDIWTDGGRIGLHLKGQDEDTHE